MLPARSFIKVGENLNQEQLSLPSVRVYSPCTLASSEDYDTDKRDVQVKQHQQGDKEQKEDERGFVDSSTIEPKNINLAESPSSSLSLTSLKLEGDACSGKSTIGTKEKGQLEKPAIAISTEISNCSWSKTNLALYVTFFVLTAVILLLLRELNLGKHRERDLLQDLEKLRTEKSRFLQELKSLKSINNCDCAAAGKPILEVENCYLNVRTTASLGQCAEDLRNDAIYWYDTYSVWWDEFFGKPNSEEREEDGGSEEKDISIEKDIIKKDKDETPLSSSKLANGSASHDSWDSFYAGFGFV